MPVKRRKPKVRIEGFPDWQIEFLEAGTLPAETYTWKLSCSSLPPGNPWRTTGQKPRFACLDSVSCAHYGAVDQKLPWLPAIRVWWAFDAPEPRLRLGGIGVRCE